MKALLSDEVRSLLSIYLTIYLYIYLSSTRMEALLSDEAIADEAKKFDSSVKMLTLREYDYLDFR